MDLNIFEQAGLTQGEAAAQIGVARLTLIRWLKGCPPRASTTPQLKRAVVLTQVAMRLGLLGDALAPSRKNQELRQQQIAHAYAQAQLALNRYKTRNTSN